MDFYIISSELSKLDCTHTHIHSQQCQIHAPNAQIGLCCKKKPRHAKSALCLVDRVTNSNLNILKRTNYQQTGALPVIYRKGHLFEPRHELITLFSFKNRYNNVGLRGARFFVIEKSILKFLNLFQKFVLGHFTIENAQFVDFDHFFSIKTFRLSRLYILFKFFIFNKDNRKM